MTEWIFVFTGFGFPQDAGLFLAGGFFALGELLVERCYAFHAGGAGVRGCPLTEKDRALLLDFGVGEGVCGCYTEAFEEGFVGEGALEAGPGIFDEAIEDGQGSELLMDVAILAV